MIYITGDTHGPNAIGYRSVDGIVPRLSRESFPQQGSLTRDDYLIICGDFGMIFDYDSRYDPARSMFRDVILLDHGESKEEKYWLDWLARKPFTILFCDGNHENFDRLDKAYPEVDFHGGRAHKIRENVCHLMRGYVYDIGGYSFFVFGGARSHDIEDGVLRAGDFSSRKEMKAFMKKMDRKSARYRVDHINWWERELPSQEEMERGLASLAAHGNKVDYVVSHCAPAHIEKTFDDCGHEDACTAFLDRVADTVSFKKWYLGHYHKELLAGGRFQILYSSIVEIGKETV